MVDLALEDINVLDFSQGISGPYCTKLFSDLGARIIKVERPDGGDITRSMGPFPEDNPHIEKSGTFLALNSNKFGITLNLRAEAARKIALQLIEWADIIVESFRPGVMERFSLDWPQVRHLKPQLVYTSISNFGQFGPYRDYRASEIIAYAMGGEMYSTGLDGLEPLKLGGTVSLFQSGSIAAIATLGALFASRDQNIGQQVDISIMETLIANQDRRAPGLLAYQYTGEIATRIPPGSTAYPMGIYECKDGYFELMAGLVRFQGAVHMLGDPDWLQDPKWHTPTSQSDPVLKEEF
ncbi:CoA transferase, partial [SAR202 cluster bacterium AD-802-E10_MRT_200m]|nr:CoA transferase [SAR202 cluster bacterium AD-802-E10_MRT_200m]